MVVELTWCEDVHRSNIYTFVSEPIIELRGQRHGHLLVVQASTFPSTYLTHLCTFGTTHLPCLGSYPNSQCTCDEFRHGFFLGSSLVEVHVLACSWLPSSAWGTDLRRDGLALKRTRREAFLFLIYQKKSESSRLDIQRLMYPLIGTAHKLSVFDAHDFANGYLAIADVLLGVSVFRA